MPRLFTAIEIPEAIRMHLSLIRAPLGGAKWIEPEDMHITLRFAGDIDGRTADELARLPGRCPRRRRSRCRSRASAPSAAATRACCGRAWRPSEPLDALHRANDRAARAAGLGPEGRAFKPHVTLARMRGGRQQAVARFLGENGGLRVQPFTATRFVLLSARPGSGGGPYVVEAEFPFEGTDAFDEADQHFDDLHPRK